MASKRYSYLHSFIFVFIIFLHIAISHGASSLLEDENSLLKFKQSLKDDSNALLSWDPAKSTPCFGSKNNWVGIICSKGGNIWGLRLENMGLSGSIDIDSLSEISRLRSLSFMNNSFSGPLPDFRKLRPLKALFLSNNKFDGSIAPNAFQGMRRLRKLYLENNKFNGKIPISLVDLEKIVELNLEGNQFDGPIPDLKSSASLKTFNVSNNQLQGPIPSSLAKFDASAFSGNKELYGPPLTKPSSSSPPPSTNNPNGPSMEAQTEDPSTSSEPESEISNKHVPIAAIAAGVSVAIILAILLIILVCKNNNCTKTNQDTSMSRSDKQWTAETPPHGSNRGFNENPSGGGGGGGGRKGESVGKLTFVREDYRPKFDLPDLLKAAAEILGSGCFGSSYKATFNDGNAVVVKRFKQMNNVGREEFQEHMRRLGRLNHPNLLPLLAYYYRKEEKLFITNPIQRGSLAVLLHGQTRGKPTLDWPTRLKVIKGVAKGLAYLYKELACLVAPHGHLKSSNVLINASYDALISDYGLIPLINQESVQEMMVAYKSPEHFNNGRITKKTDVWALGILIVEVLTGKFPSSYLQNGTEVDMTIWVRSVINEGFDKNMNSTRNCEGEMQKLLNIGMACCESNVDKRLDINQACDQIQELHDPDLEDDFYSTCDSTEPGSRNSSRPASHDFTVVIN